jgi:tetratricopeptide (TPR) repeat protein
MVGSKETKEILKKPDEFLTISAKVLQWAREHGRPVRYVGFAVAAAAVVFIAANTYLRYADRKGQDAYNKAYNAIAETNPSEKAKESVPDAVTLFEEVIKDHSLSGASDLALAQLANLKYREKNYDEAITLYRKFLDRMAGKTRYENLTKLALSACYEAKADLKNALELLNSVRDYPLLKETALWNLARLYRLSNETEKEKEALKQFAEEFTDSPFLPLAKARLL